MSYLLFELHIMLRILRMTADAKGEHTKLKFFSKKEEGKHWSNASFTVH